MLAILWLLNISGALQIFKSFSRPSALLFFLHLTYINNLPAFTHFPLRFFRFSFLLCCCISGVAVVVAAFWFSIYHHPHLYAQIFALYCGFFFFFIFFFGTPPCLASLCFAIFPPRPHPSLFLAIFIRIRLAEWWGGGRTSALCMDFHSMPRNEPK